MIIKINLAYNSLEDAFLDIVYKSDSWEYKSWYTFLEGEDTFTPEIYDSYQEYMYQNNYIIVPLIEFEQ